MINKIETIKDACYFFWKIESDYNLLDYNINDKYIWQYCRFHIFEKVLIKAGIIKAPHSIFSAKKKEILSYIFSSMFKSPFYIPPKTEVLIFEHKRKKQINEKWVDIYTENISDFINNKNVSYITNRDSGKHFPHDRKIFHLDLFVVAAQFSAKMRFVKNKDICYSFNQINDKIGEVFNIKFDLVKELNYYLSVYSVYLYLYRRLLQKMKLEKIIIVVNYNNYVPLCQAAKELQIPVFEIQHGIITKYHMGYSYPNVIKNSLIGFPDYLIVWDRHLSKLNEIPLSEDRFIVNKNNHISNGIKKYLQIEKQKKTIAVISQGSIGASIAEVLFNNIEKLKDYVIHYKLHPGEYKSFVSYEKISKLQKYENVIFYNDDNIHLYEILARCEIVIGVYSTVLFESTFFNCKLIILNLPGHEYMENYIKNNQAYFAENNELFSILSKINN